MEFINSLPTWVTALTLIIFGLVALIGIFDRNMRDRRKETDAQEDRIIDLYKVEIEELNKSLAKTNKEIEILKAKMLKLETENSVMTKLIQGRDTEAIKYRERGIQTMDMALAMSGNIIENGESIKKCIKSIERLAKAIERHLQSIEK